MMKFDFKKHLKLSKKPKTSFGFPIREVKNSPKKSENQRGVAIIIALMIITFMVGFIADLVLSSRVANQMSINIEERSKTEYLAGSGVNIAKFILLIDWGLDLFMASNMKQAVVDGPGDFWSMLNGLPIGSGEAKMMAQMQEAFDLSEVMDSKVMNQLDLFEGQFVMDISDEDSKININYLVKENLSKDSVYPMLVSLFSCPAESEFLDRKELTPEQLAARVADYIDANKRVKTGADYTSEEDPYSDLTPRRSPKNLPLDTIDELKLIDKWDDDIHAVFSPYLTVYPIAKEYYSSLSTKELAKMATVNINTSSRGFIGCLFAEMDLDCKEDFARKFSKKLADKENLAEGENMASTLRNLACYEGGEDDKKSSWFKSNSSTFKVKVQGLMGDSISEIETVVYRLDPSVMKKKKIKHAADLLYWKMQ